MNVEVASSIFCLLIDAYTDAYTVDPHIIMAPKSLYLPVYLHLDTCMLSINKIKP